MSELIIAHSYTPMDDDPPPSQIIWMSEHLWGFGIGMADACLAYCLEPKDLKGLKAKCGWLDLQSVAVKALKVHGGLKGHNEIVLARRKADVDTIQELFRQKSSYDSGRPIKPYSKSLRDFLKARLLRPAPSRSEEILQRTVLQYAPIFIEQQGRRWRWRHGRYSLGSRDLPPGCCLDIQA
ncbi:hypothetical protein MPER_08979 [Moniliophthora perniciosa FA553]|nr:hypothetical protein MPER_08979 [Moniliophthora perniciosa FA553]